MEKLITDFLDKAVDLCPDKTVFIEKDNKVTYKELRIYAQAIARALEERRLLRKPVAVFFEKSIMCVETFLGVAYSGNFYCLIDIDMPDARAKTMLDALKPSLLITDKRHASRAKKITKEIPILIVEEQIDLYYGQIVCKDLRTSLLSEDILYILFTSGSTGIPKGVITSHRALISYVNSVAEAYRLDENTIIGNQVPFYYVMSIFDIYATIAIRAQMHIIPRKYFAFPGMVVRYIHYNNINTINWVPSALALVSNVNGFKAADISCVKTVLFGGEVMPVKHLNAWRRVLPNASFFNGYGSTECTEASLFYEVNREFNEGDVIPIGRPYSNTEALVFNEENKIVENEVGELYIRSDALSYGYYRDNSLTDKVFIQNPLHNRFRDIVYKTGDLVRYNQYGEIEYIGRIDDQIKHMGRRIALGEIEANVSSINGVRENCCIYDNNKQQIVLFFSGEIESEKIVNELKKTIPDYMLPTRWEQVKELPRNPNGKIDRSQLSGWLSSLNNEK
ncbi:MAG: amino acid adenylation domain-containing protein [Mogibacterium sp.]|nr:amino acid adenylation domain-containing protein [Mogibacterium sp.]